jgi:hypothetical protein
VDSSIVTIAQLENHVSELLATRDAITESLILAQDQLMAVTALSELAFSTFGKPTAQDTLFAAAKELTTSDSVSLWSRAEAAEGNPAPDSVASIVIAALEDTATLTPHVYHDGRVVVIRLSGTRKTDHAIVFERAAGPAYSTVDTRLVQVVASTLGIITTLGQMRVEQVHGAALNRELEIASELAQSVMAVSLPTLPGAELFARTIPARIAGGDLYTAMAVDGVLWFAVGDVAGKGLRAAIVMSRIVNATRTAIAVAPAGVDPSDVLTVVSDELHDYLDESGFFVTIALGTFSPQTGEVALVNAGHSPVIATSSTGLVTIAASVPPLGIIIGRTADTVRITLEYGHCLVLGTDGLTEQQATSGSMFGTERFLNLCGASTSSADELGDRLFDAVDHHGRGVPATDDRTLLVIRRERSAA